MFNLRHRAAKWIHGFLGPVSRLRLYAVPTPARWVMRASLVALAVMALLFPFEIYGPRVEILRSGTSFFLVEIQETRVEMLRGRNTAPPLALAFVLIAWGLAFTLMGLAASRASSWSRIAWSAGVLTAAFLALAQLLSITPYRGAWIATGVTATSLGLLRLKQLKYIGLPLQILALMLPYLLIVVSGFPGGQVDLLFLASTLVLLPLAACAAGILAVGSIAESLQSPFPRVRRWIGKPRSRLFVAGILVLKLVVVVTFYCGGSGEFIGAGTLWNPRLDAPLSWLHAIAVGVAIFSVVAVSEKRTLLVTGRTPAIAMILVASALLPIAGAISAFGGRWFGAAEWIVDNAVELQLVAILLFAAVASVDVFRRRQLTAGSAVLLIACLWLLPAITGMLAVSAHSDVPTFWAAPAQVDTALTCVVAALLYARGEWALPTRVHLRMLLLPPILVYAVVLLPGKWIAVERLVLVLALLWMLAARAPHVAAEPERQIHVLGSLLGVPLATLTVYYLASMSEVSALTSGAAYLGWLWLAVPVAAIFTARVRAPPIPN